MNRSVANRMRVRSYLATVGAALMLASCAAYQPLKDIQLDHGPLRAPSGPGISVTYFGNTTFLVSDGETKLLVDGFFSRPPALRVARGRVQPDLAIIAEQLGLGGVGRVTALLVGHSHYNHALDAPIAFQTGAFVRAAHRAPRHRSRGLPDCGAGRMQVDFTISGTKSATYITPGFSTPARRWGANGSAPLSCSRDGAVLICAVRRGRSRDPAGGLGSNKARSVPPLSAVHPQRQCPPCRR